MCFRVLVAANANLPVDRAINDDTFHVRQLNNEEVRAISFIHQPYAYEVISWQGCGCGFSYEKKVKLQEALRDLPKEEHVFEINAWENGRKSVHHLGEWIRQCTEIASVDLYACWYGKELEMPQNPRKVSIDYFNSDSFNFRKTEWLQLSRLGTTRVGKQDVYSQAGAPASY